LMCTGYTGVNSLAAAGGKKKGEFSKEMIIFI
jgi:hypothetical protein